MLTAESLKDYYPFNTFEPKFLPLLLEEIKEFEVKKGTILFRQGKQSKHTKYLLEGAVQMVQKDGRDKTVKSTSLQSKYPLSDANKSSKIDATVITNTCKGFGINSILLDHFRVWNDLFLASPKDSPLRGHDSYHWVIGLLKSRSVQMLPQGHIEQIFKELEPERVHHGDEIISEGEAGQYCYVIAAGKSAVFKCKAEGEAKVAHLGPGDLFGENALISNEPRNASVRMTSDGLLMKLEGKRFSALLKSHVVRWITSQTALEKIARGGILVDVREEDEFARQRIEGCINMPSSDIRQRIKKLDPKKPIITCSNQGGRSASAAFLLATLGFDVYALQGGINSLLKSADL